MANLLQRVQTQLAAQVARIVERLRSARLVRSDETSARITVATSESGCSRMSRHVCM